MNYLKMTNEELKLEYNKLLDDYEKYQSKNLKLDMSRGKLSEEQLDLSNEFLNLKISQINIDNIDIRNYGCLDGLPSAKQLFAELFQVDKSEIFIGGNSSLNLIHDVISNLMLVPSLNSKPWCKYKEIKFLCPTPGYDRHFAICEKLGIRMINIDMNNNGPDMDQIERAVKQDSSIKGIICVPKYSNPTGVTYSNETICRLVNLETKAKDFTLFFDNAYAEHHLFGIHDVLLNILDESKKSKNKDRVYIFSSTSKMIFPGAGISFLMSTSNNIAKVKKWFGAQTIGYDKINQLRHVLFFKDVAGVREHMKKHAQILRPKFQIIDQILSENFSNQELVRWSKPYGGYFISLETLPGCAKKVVNLCKNAGVTFTDAGVTYPYGVDPNDSNIRIAPSYPSVDQLKMSINLLCLAIKMVSIEKIVRIN